MTFEEIEKLKQQQCPRFSDFAKDQLPMPGVKKHLDSVINREIMIVDHRIRNSTKRDGTQCLQLQFIMDGEVCVLFTGSSVLINQTKAFVDKIPFKCTISKIDKYYSFA